MEISERKVAEYARRLQLSRMRLMCNQSFYGLLLTHLKYSLDELCSTAYTDGERIAFSPDFLDEISDSELDFVMMHEILHVVLLHCFRTGERDAELFNIACDIVVNSNILKSCGMERARITLKKYGESMHYAPDGKEGYEYTAEEVYEMLKNKANRTRGGYKFGTPKNGGTGGGQNGGENGKARGHGCFDDHSKWKTDDTEQGEFLKDVWIKRLSDAAHVVSVLDPANGRGTVPACAERLIGKLKNPQTDWRTILDNFIQEEINDYSFSPPDRRFGDTDFFLPDFNEKEEVVKNVLFMIDTSGSISDKTLSTAYSEIKGAIDQYDGRLRGWLGFFDAAIYEPTPFEGVSELLKIKPVGGGGTDFGIIFKYVQKNMQDDPPVSIVVLTDGIAPFPKEKETMGIPVLWLLTNEEITPPWGKISRIKVD